MMMRTALSSLVLTSLLAALGACTDGAGDGDDDGGGGDDTNATSTTTSTTTGAGTTTAATTTGGRETCGDIPNEDDCAGQWSCSDGGWVCDAGPICPNGVPSEGAACDASEPCVYSTGDSCTDTIATCEDGQWALDADYVCDDPSCPDDEPRDGDDCEVDGLTCEYEDPDSCGAQPTYECKDGAWDRLPEQIGCAPDCSDFVGAEQCEAYDCRWLEPASCPEDLSNLEAAGCFDLDPCTEGSCDEGETCVELAVEPECADRGCDACAETTLLCQPAPVE